MVCVMYPSKSALDPLFGRLLLSQPSTRSSASTPSHDFDIVEHKDSFEIVTDAPGCGPSDITIELKDKVLTVSACPKPRTLKRAESDVVWRSERRTHLKFSRSFELPEEAGEEGISASLDMGLLTILVPKRTPRVVKPKRITITAPEHSRAASPAVKASTPTPVLLEVSPAAKPAAAQEKATEEQVEEIEADAAPATQIAAPA